MKQVPSYGKILTLGALKTEKALEGEVVIQEKVDGSQFGFGKNEDGELVFRSKNQQLHKEAVPKMFAKGVNYLLSIEDKFQGVPNDTYFYAEYLEKTKHNVLNYNAIPQNHLVLFDVLENGNLVRRNRLEEYGKLFNIDVVPQIKFKVLNVEGFKKLLELDSYLGGVKIEGLVIKNYNETIEFNGKIMPLFTKYVSEKFKEKHRSDWKKKKPKTDVNIYLQSFRAEARWQKAIQRATEQELLSHEPRDIGLLMPMITKDLLEEEKEEIKETLFKFFEKDLLRSATAGFPEWYKNKLLERAFNE